ncbi:MAG TPA: tripartite tricarboxylate transporter substrate binding protein [Methylomirabilota bacterium]|nr:tripartite tricarboxylate transporter substrate binding protein [Methylomirabilota bacterium]
MTRLALALLVVLGSAVPAAAQYPERPVTAIFGYPAGGLADVVLRALTEGMKKKFPKGIAVVARPGAGGTIGASEVIRSKPDGYTLGIMPLTNLVIQPQVMDLPYKTPDDCIPVISLVSWYPLLAVKHDAPWKSAQEFVAAARANPGKLRVGSPGEGTSSHLNLEELMRVSDARMTHVPFSGWGEGSPALLGGHIEALVAQPGEVRPLVESKRMRVLAVFQPARNTVFPDVPSFKELGYSAHNGSTFFLVMPNGTPPDVVRYVHDAAKAAMDEAAFVNFAKARVIDVDYRAGDKLKSDLWSEYKAHTEILKRLGMLRK